MFTMNNPTVPRVYQVPYIAPTSAAQPMPINSASHFSINSNNTQHNNNGNSNSNSNLNVIRPQQAQVQ